MANAVGVLLSCAPIERLTRSRGRIPGNAGLVQSRLVAMRFSELLKRRCAARS